MSGPKVEPVEKFARRLLRTLPRSNSGNAHALLDVIDAWGAKGYSGRLIQDALDRLWQDGLVLTDDYETPPIYPRASILASSPAGDIQAASKSRIQHGDDGDGEFN